MMKRISLMIMGAASVTALGAWPGGGAEAAQRPLSCTSTGGLQECRAGYDIRMVAIQSAQAGRCSFNETWGYDGEKVWTDRGCSATFTVWNYEGFNDSSYAPSEPPASAYPGALPASYNGYGGVMTGGGQPAYGGQTTTYQPAPQPYQPAPYQPAPYQPAPEYGTVTTPYQPAPVTTYPAPTTQYGTVTTYPAQPAPTTQYGTVTTYPAQPAPTTQYGTVTTYPTQPAPQDYGTVTTYPAPAPATPAYGTQTYGTVTTYPAPQPAPTDYTLGQPAGQVYGDPGTGYVPPAPDPTDYTLGQPAGQVYGDPGTGYAPDPSYGQSAYDAAKDAYLRRPKPY